MKLSKHVINANVCAFFYPLIWIFFGNAAEMFGAHVTYAALPMIIGTVAGWSVAYMASRMSSE